MILQGIQRFPTQESISYAGISPTGDMFYVSDEGILRTVTGSINIETGVENCNGAVFLPNRLLVGGRGQTLILKYPETHIVELKLDLNCTGAEVKSGLAVLALGMDGILVVGQTSGFHVGPGAISGLPDWIEQPIPRLRKSSVDIRFESPVFTTVDAENINALFAGGKHGVLFLKSGRKPPAEWVVGGIE